MPILLLISCLPLFIPVFSITQEVDSLFGDRSSPILRCLCENRRRVSLNLTGKGPS